MNKQVVIAGLCALLLTPAARAAQWKKEACSIHTVHLLGTPGFDASKFWKQEMKTPYKNLMLPDWVKVVKDDEPADDALVYGVFNAGSEVSVNPVRATAGRYYKYVLTLAKFTGKGTVPVHTWKRIGFAGNYTETYGNTVSVKHMDADPLGWLHTLVHRYRKLKCK